MLKELLILGLFLLGVCIVLASLLPPPDNYVPYLSLVDLSLYIAVVVLGLCLAAISLLFFLIYRVIYGKSKSSGCVQQLLRGSLVCLVLVGGVLLVKAGWMFALAPSAESVLSPLEKEDIFARRSYLIGKITSSSFGLGDMPWYVPQMIQREWEIVTLSMTSAAVANLAFQYPETRPEAVEVIRQALGKLLSPDCRDFERENWGKDPIAALSGNNGNVGYLGHLNLTLAAYALLGGGHDFDELFSQVSAALARRMDNSPSHYIETFPRSIFIPDNMVAVSSLAVFNSLHNNAYAPAIARWLDYTKKSLIDPQTGLIVNWVSHDGSGYGTSRGSYAAWNLFHLFIIDRDFAATQYANLKKHFLSQALFGAQAIREYAPGHTGSGDIDSGPVVFGLSTSGTGFALAGAAQMEDRKVLRSLLLTAEAAGFSIQYAGKRRYLLAPLVGDALILAMRTARPWDLRYTDKDHDTD
jgi:hypothetical protein